MILRRGRKRRGATIVEAAFVLPIAVLFLFGLFEYCRFVFLVQVAENAAREGARYAVTGTADGTTKADIQAYVADKMGGRQGELAGFYVEVENVNPATGAVIAGSQWYDAPFGGAIRVKITGTYSPTLPSFLKLPTSIPLTFESMMSSEAN
ncbi:MAG: pilus assembly protein [Gemmataceae bacterium]|nr:pilus assembly protein [Gemmataceae bacterium]